MEKIYLLTATLNQSVYTGLGRRTFPILRQTASWMSDYLAVKPTAVGQPTWRTQPSIPQGSVNE